MFQHDFNIMLENKNKQRPYLRVTLCQQSNVLLIIKHRWIILYVYSSIPSTKWIPCLMIVQSTMSTTLIGKKFHLLFVFGLNKYKVISVKIYSIG